MKEPDNRTIAGQTCAECSTSHGVTILFTGDLHFNRSYFHWLEEHKDEYDCLCLTGDVLDGSSEDFKQQAGWVSNWLVKFDKQVFICSGNHDLDECGESAWQTNLNSQKVCVDNRKKIFHGIRFGCMPYLGADLSIFKDCDVLVTHVPPSRTATSRSMVNGLIKDWGDRELHFALRARNLTPKYVLCGHVESPISNRDVIGKTVICNPGAEHHSAIPCHDTIIIRNQHVKTTIRPGRSHHVQTLP